MAELTVSVAKAIAEGQGATAWEIYQLARAFLHEHGMESPPYVEPAALSHAAGQDGEQCRAASGDAGEAEELAQWLDAKFKRHGEIEDKRAAKLLRALSRGVPEGMVLVPMEPTQAMLDAFCNLEPDKITEFHYYGGLTGYDHFTTEEGAKLVWSTMLAAIAAQRKEGPDA